MPTQALIVKLDPRGKGEIEFNSFMDVLMKFFREKYDEFKEISLMNLKDYFDTLDINGDGSLDHNEFKHVMNRYISRNFRNYVSRWFSYFSK